LQHIKDVYGLSQDSLAARFSAFSSLSRYRVKGYTRHLPDAQARISPAALPAFCAGAQRNCTNLAHRLRKIPELLPMWPKNHDFALQRDCQIPGFPT
jgi:hypothetical protein